MRTQHISAPNAPFYLKLTPTETTALFIVLHTAEQALNFRHIITENCPTLREVENEHCTQAIFALIRDLNWATRGGAVDRNENGVDS